MNEETTKYVGITDFASREDVDQAYVVWKELPIARYRKLHVGVMMSRKTLFGIPTSWADIFPPRESLADIFSHTEVFNCLHYADYENVGVENSLMLALQCVGEHLHGVQLDMIWPDPETLASCLYEHQVILQINETSFEMCRNDPQRVVERLRHYDHVISHVLLDDLMLIKATG